MDWHNCQLLVGYHPQFKDYEKSPIGFGVVVFCIAKTDCRPLYERFYEGFSPWGEPNIPIDMGKLPSYKRDASH
jgi:hypothetical protein